LQHIFVRICTKKVLSVLNRKTRRWFVKYIFFFLLYLRFGFFYWLNNSMYFTNNTLIFITWLKLISSNSFYSTFIFFWFPLSFFCNFIVFSSCELLSLVFKFPFNFNIFLFKFLLFCFLCLPFLFHL